MIAVSTNYGIAGDEFLNTSGGAGSSRSRTRNTCDSYAMKSMKRSSWKKRCSGDMNSDSTPRPAPLAVLGERFEGYLGTGVEHRSSIEATRRKPIGHDARSVGSTESTKIMIRKDVEITVTY